MSETKVCPRCLKPIAWIERDRRGDRTYLYAIHKVEEPNKVGPRGVRFTSCYLGPEEYVYVSKLHEREGLVLRGLIDTDRDIEYAERILQYLVNDLRAEAAINPQVVRETVREIEETAKKLIKLLQSLRSLKKQ